MPKTEPPPRRRLPRGEGERLREEILAAAEQLLVETESEDAVSIRAVAEAVGVTPPSIYRHFSDKDTLLLEVCSHSFEHFTTALEEVIDAGAPPEDQLADLGHAYIRYAREFPEHYRIMFMSRFELSAQAYAEEMMTEASSFGLLLRISQGLIDAGSVRPEIAERGALHVGILCWATVHGLASLLVAKPGLPWPDIDALEHDIVAVSMQGALLGHDR